MRTKSDYYRDYHIEQILPVALKPPPKLPVTPEVKQHPESDSIFMTLIIDMEECSNINNGCDNCGMKKDCERLQSAFSERGSDRPVKEVEAREFINKFLRLRMGEKI
jgi:hypothetical protein